MYQLFELIHLDNPHVSDEVTEFLTEVTVERTSETSITVFWTPPQGAIQDQFHYYQLLASYGNDIRKAINLPLNVTTYIFQDLTSGAKYKVELKACSMYTLQCVPSTTPENKGMKSISTSQGYWEL